MSDSRGHEFDVNAAGAAGSDARGAAREQFVHGLLETMHRDGAAQIDQRVNGVLGRLEEPLPSRRAPARRVRPWAWVTGLAAAAALVLVGILGLPTERTAAAMVQASLLASRTAGDRRYDVRGTFDDAAGEIHYATLDVHSPECYVIRAILSKGDDLVVGRDVQGDWALKHTGEIDRLPPRKLLPSWVNSDQGAVGMVSVDDVLGEMADSYTLTRQKSEVAPSGKGAACERVSANRVNPQGREARRVEMWFDPSTHVLRWMELYFDPVPVAEHEEGGPPRRGDGERRRPPPPPDGRGPPRGGGPPPGRDGPGAQPGGRPFSDPFRDRRAPPKKLVFELMGNDELGPEWFRPETHSRIRREGK